MALTTYHHLALRLKKEYSYISNPILDLCGLFWGELYLYLYHCDVLVVLYTVTSSVGCSEIYVRVYHGYHSCVLAVTFWLFFVSLFVVAFCRCFCSMMCSFSNPLLTALCNNVNIFYFVVFFFLGDFSVSEFYVPTFQNTLSVPSS